MRPAAILLTMCANLVGGCAPTVVRSTPDEMRAAPGAIARLTTPMSLDRTFTKTMDQLKACFERGIGATRVTASGNKSNHDANVTLAVAGLFNYQIIATMTLKPASAGTDVVLYSANAPWSDKLHHGLTNWLIADAASCPDDAPVQ